jgi:uncharacterized membrane-anchored protein YhcB (DUF1043 family)
MDWLKLIGLALAIGAPIGMLIMGFLIGATRCEECCQRDKKKV